jgi:hypothetical protein
MTLKKAMSDKKFKIGAVIKHSTPLNKNNKPVERYGIIISENIYGFKIAWQYCAAFSQAPIEAYLDHSTIRQQEFAIISE